MNTFILSPASFLLNRIFRALPSLLFITAALWMANAAAIAAPGTVVAWGSNSQDGQTTIPAGLSGVTAIAAGYAHTAALKNDGTLVAWGNNAQGQTSIPAGLSGVTAIAAGSFHTVALKNDGTVVAWGDTAFGQTTIPAGLSGVTAIAAGEGHTVALKSNGTVVAWGNTAFGQTTIPAGLSGVTAIAAGDNHTVALKSNGTVVAWGYNNIGQTTIPAGLSGVTAIAAGGYHTVALKQDGTVVAWGDTAFGQTTIPAGLSGVTAIAAGSFHTAALKNDGTVTAWGRNNSGETTIPAGLSGVTAIGAGDAFTVALTINGVVSPPDHPQVIYKSVGNQTVFGNGKVLHITAKGFLVLSSGVTFGDPVKATAIVGFTLNGLKLFSVVPLENYRWDTYSGAKGATYSTMAKAESPGTQFDGVLLEAVYLRGRNTSLRLSPSAVAFMPRTFFSSARAIGLNSQTGIKTVGEVTGSYVFDAKATFASNQLETYNQAVTRLSNGFAGRGYTQFSPTPAQ